MITEIFPANPFITSKHSSLEKAMEEAECYREWKEAALALDKLEASCFADYVNKKTTSS
jgi:hypothetical protein